MQQKIIDLRSDTLTTPDKKMLEACLVTEMGDEFYEEAFATKKLDMIIANPVNEVDGGFYNDNNRGWIISNDKTIELPLMNKKFMANKILEIIALSM